MPSKSGKKRKDVAPEVGTQTNQREDHAKPIHIDLTEEASKWYNDEGWEAGPRAKFTRIVAEVASKVAAGDPRFTAVDNDEDGKRHVEVSLDLLKEIVLGPPPAPDIRRAEQVLQEAAGDLEFCSRFNREEKGFSEAEGKFTEAQKAFSELAFSELALEADYSEVIRLANEANLMALQTGVESIAGRVKGKAGMAGKLEQVESLITAELDKLPTDDDMVVTDHVRGVFSNARNALLALERRVEAASPLSLSEDKSYPTLNERRDAKNRRSRGRIGHQRHFARRAGR